MELNKIQSNSKRLSLGLVTLLILSFFLLNFSETKTIQAAEIGLTSTNNDVQSIAQGAGAFSKVSTDSLNNIKTEFNGQSAVLELAGEENYAPHWAGAWKYYGMADSETLRYQTAFNLATANWDATTPLGTAIELDVRASQDGTRWTFWETLKSSGETAKFDTSQAYLYLEYRVRLFSLFDGVTPSFRGVTFDANKRDVTTLKPFAAPTPPPTYSIYGTRQGMVGGRTANGHIITERDRFVSMSSWRTLNKKDKYDYQIKIYNPANGKSATVPQWDVGPWNNNDNYWHNPRDVFKDLPIGVPQAEKAYFDGHNGGKNEFGNKVQNPSALDIGDGTYIEDLGMNGWAVGKKIDVTFLFEGSTPPPAELTNIAATDIGSGTATVRWKSSTPLATWVEYGFEDGKYPFKTSVNANLNTTHAFFINGLVPHKTYHFRVRGKDTFGTEAISKNNSFKTGDGQTAQLVGFTKDAGIGVTIDPEFKSIKIAGGRANASLWNDNPKDDFHAGALTLPFNIRNIGALDVDLNPSCDDKGQNCAFGFGSGYKSYVKFTNSAGDYLYFGMISSVGLSEKGMMLYVEGMIGGNPVWKFYDPDALATNRGYHLQLVWQNGNISGTFDYFTLFDNYKFDFSQLQINFGGAARYKDDVIAVNFQNIAFSFGTVLQPDK